jgi:hypothetical protein
MSHRYVKVRFASKHGATAGLVFRLDLFPMTTVALSRCFPHSEARFMERLEVSPDFDTWEAAFHHCFDR